MIEKLEPIARFYDRVHQAWEDPRCVRSIAILIFFTYLLALFAIELNRLGILPSACAHIVPMKHFQAIHFAFTLILGMEVLALIFTLSESLSQSLGKQFEVMALILLRSAFKELSELPEPASFLNPETLFHIASAGTGALVIFVCLGFYHRLRVHQNYMVNLKEQKRYVIAKKIVSLVLVFLFILLMARDLFIFANTGEKMPFFESIYTIMILADIALILISHQFMPIFHAVFRNSGFAIGTLIMRLALSAPWPWDIAAGIFAALYVLGVTWATVRFGPSRMHSHVPRGKGSL